MKIEIQKYSKNPIFTPLLEKRSFERDTVYNPGAVVKNNKVYLLYRAEDFYPKKYVSSLGIAISKDGFNFKRYSKNPVITGNRKEEWRGCEDPRIVKINDNFFLTYTASGKRETNLAGAFSKNLIHWRKTGILIPGEKSGTIVQNYKYKDNYVMYFGKETLKIAFSNNLKKWEVLKKPVLPPRKDCFDSFLTEGGIPPIVVKDGIMVIYNSARKEGCFKVYSPGLAIFDKNNPTKLLFRSKKPIIESTEYWEKYGKVNYAIFATGLVKFKQKWLLYYGGADKSIGVASIKF